MPRGSHLLGHVPITACLAEIWSLGAAPEWIESYSTQQMANGPDHPCLSGMMTVSLGPQPRLWRNESVILPKGTSKAILRRGPRETDLSEWPDLCTWVPPIIGH